MSKSNTEGAATMTAAQAAAHMSTEANKIANAEDRAQFMINFMTEIMAAQERAYNEIRSAS
jgi:hypothetical protein